MKTKSKHLLILLSLLGVSAGGWSQVGGLTQTGDMTVCQNATESYGVVATAGSTYVWTLIAGTGGAGIITPGADPNNLITVSWTTPGTCTLQVVESTATCTGLPVTILVTVLPVLVPGTASASQMILSNTAPLPISATAPSGGNGAYTYQWEFSVDGGGTWSAVTGATDLTYAPGILTQTTMYHLIQTSGGRCGSVTTNAVTITIQAPLMAGTAAADQTICYNSTPAPISATEPTGGNGVYTYQWEYSIDGGATWNVISGAIALTYEPGALTQTTKYHLIQTSGGGFGSVTTNVVTLTVEPQIMTSQIWHN
ncbi:MAG: hypothetical protein PHY99_06880 [Bacteroidales bacterium]|nr:hypothetical protein [Bacteroidales bacterium]